MVYREGRPRKYPLTIETFPLKTAARISRERYGLSLTGKGRLKNGGLPVDKVKPNGLKKGDIVHQVNEIKINKMDDYLKAIAKYRLRNSLGLIVQRGRYAYNVTLTP
ncbi:MAG: hypothetical protein JRI85_13565 [Deltaproteobacteria bacterium]|nr:hypothetical protein [Deltaproteobacteria bacterium]